MYGWIMERCARRAHHAHMRNLSGLARFGLAGLALGTLAIVASFIVPGEMGALLRGYGAMLLPAAAYLFAGLALRHFLAGQRNESHARAPIRISARDGSLRP